MNDQGIFNCDTCGEEWWSDEPPACTCPDGGRWLFDRQPKPDGGSDG